MSATVDMTGFNAKIGELQGFGLSTGRILKVESRRLLESVMKQTHPQYKAQGEAAIQKDLGKVFYAVDDKTAANAEPMKGSAAGFTKLWVTPGSDRNKVVCVRTPNFKPNASVQTMEAIHKATRSPKDGRVHGTGAEAKRIVKGRLNMINRVVVRESAWEAYRKHVSAHVGKLKSGFLRALRAVGGSAGKAWVSRHAHGNQGPTGFVTMNLQGEKPFIAIGNTAAGAEPRLGGIVQRALAGRVKAITTNIKRMVKFGPGKSGDYGYATK